MAMVQLLATADQGVLTAMAAGGYGADGRGRAQLQASPQEYIQRTDNDCRQRKDGTKSCVTDGSSPVGCPWHRTEIGYCYTHFLYITFSLMYLYLLLCDIV